MNNKKYIYEEIKDFIKTRIDNNLYASGCKIPSESDFVKVFGVHRKTIRTAISSLEKEGLLKTIQGKGVYVTNHNNEISIFDGYCTDDFIKEHEHLKVIEENIRQVGDFYKNVFQCQSNDTMYVFQIVHSIENNAVIFEQIYIQRKFINNIEKYDIKAFNTNDIYRFENIKIKHIQQYLNIVNISERNAKYLNLEKNNKVILLEKKSFNQNDDCVEYRKQYIRGDLIRITNTFKKRGF